MQEKIDLARDNYANVANNETRARLLWQLDQAWQMPIRKFQTSVDQTGYGVQAEGDTRPGSMPSWLASFFRNSSFVKLLFAKRLTS
jgi:hypothetical protein